jgi:hypothetical protein
VNIQRSFVAFLVALFGWCSQAHAQAQETRVALVIGNSNYKNSPLKNPVNDARDMATKLRGLGFTVIERNNLVVKQIGSTLREFRSKLTPGSVALVYYAGHGLQIKGDNYFPTVDADITGEEDVPNQSLAMKQIMDVLGDAKTRLNLVFLDACRDNPYSRSFRSASKGLSKENAPSGTLISFATRPGSVAADGVGRNGLYTGALLEAMDNKGQPIEQILKRVVTSVKAGSRNQQEPWMEGSIEGEFCFGVCGGVASSVSEPKITASDDRALWDAVKESRDPTEISLYLEKFPNGLFSGIAKARISSLSSPVTSLPTTNQNSKIPSGANEQLTMEFLDRIYVGTWSSNCDDVIYKSRFDRQAGILETDTIVKGKTVTKGKINFSSLKYLGKEGNIFLFELISESKSVSTESNFLNRVIFETDMVTYRRTRQSESVISGATLIKDGVLVANNQAMKPLKRCN